MILDQTLFYPAIKKIGNLRNRGRVDILHRALLTILDSSLSTNKLLLGVAVHTINNDIYMVAPHTRLPRHYFRFLGLMEKLLESGVIRTPEGEPLIWREKNIRACLENNNIEYVIGFSRRGSLVDLEEYLIVKTDEYSRIGLVFGAFPKGFFSPPVQEIIDDLISIDSKPHTTSYTLCRVIITLEHILLK